jgi:flavin reductase (DIM6/NTAB) family NADH-FMN oxidoreductase RutF
MQTLISSADIRIMESRKRAHFINSLGGFKSISLVATVDKFSNENLAIFSSIVHLGASPALIALIFRPSPPERDTLRNILDTEFYSINHISEEIYKKAHQTAAKYEAGQSEFDATGLNPEYKNDFCAPYVAESKVQIGVQYREKIDISLNMTTMIIGEIIQVHVPSDCMADDGFIDLEKAKTITCSGLDSYHRTQKIDRLSYAKVGSTPRTLV